MILDDLRDNNEMLWQLRLQNLEKEHDRVFGSGTCKREDDIYKTALGLIEKASKLWCVVPGSTAAEQAKAAEIARLNEMRMQATLGYINGVCTTAKELTEGKEDDD